MPSAHPGGRHTASVVEDDVLWATPGERARAAADALGDDALTAWCAALLAGRASWGDPADPDPHWVGGAAVDGWGAPDHLDERTAYWARVWAARTLLYVWDERCSVDVVAGLGDPAWRVREMCAKVAARWEVAGAADACLVLVDDAVSRVRAAAARVLGAMGDSEHTAAAVRLLDDADVSVRAAAERALGPRDR